MKLGLLTLREEYTLSVFKNRVLRKIFGSKRNKVTWGWRRLHDEELSDIFSSPNIVRTIKWGIIWAELVARLGDRSGAYAVLMKEPEGNRSL